MATPIETFLDNIRAEFQRLLEGPGVTWNKPGMLLQLEKAISKALAQEADIY